MNILNEKVLCTFLKKLNTIKLLKPLSEELVSGILSILSVDYCSVYIVNTDTNKTALKCVKSVSNISDKIKNIGDEIFLLGTDLFTNPYDTPEILDFLSKMSKDNIIITPVFLRDILAGFITVISSQNDFNEKYQNIIDIIAENFNSRLDVITLENILGTSNKQKIQFLAGISHEYKTPLNSIIGFSDILKSNIVDTKQYKYIDNINKSAKFLLSLIQDILDLARAEFTKIELNYSKFRPKEIIEDIILSFEEQINSKNLNFSYTMMDVELSADIRRFKQLIFNLISNAVKFNKPGGSITIVSYSDENKNFVFEIKDSGDGIRKRDYDRIFNFFSQVNRSQLKRQQGSGVGLALCKMIVNAHNGKIGFKSRLNYGSTFWFRLPIEDLNQNYK